MAGGRCFLRCFCWHPTAGSGDWPIAVACMQRQYFPPRYCLFPSMPSRWETMKKTPASSTPAPVEPAKPRDIPYGQVVAVPALPFTHPPAFVPKKPKWS